MKLSFLIPCYNVKKYLVANKKMWISLSKMVKLVFVEDTKSSELAQIIKEIGGEYYSKENGNWGSVINFAKDNKLITTKYMAIVDPDDSINLKELDFLVNSLDDDDLYITNFQKIYAKSKRSLTKKIIVGNDYPFIHALWLKTSIFYGISDLPEKVFFTDNHFIVDVASRVKTFKKIEAVPYNYYLELNGQSMDETAESLESKIISFRVLANIVTWMNLNGIEKNFAIVPKYNMQYGGVDFTRRLYDKADRNMLKYIRNIYRKNLRGVKPLKKSFIWSIMYRVFKR